MCEECYNTIPRFKLCMYLIRQSLIAVAAKPHADSIARNLCGLCPLPHKMRQVQNKTFLTADSYNMVDFSHGGDYVLSKIQKKNS